MKSVWLSLVAIYLMAIFVYLAALLIPAVIIFLLIKAIVG